MATNEAGKLGRQLALQVVHYMRKGITYEDNSGVVGILPANAIVLGGNVYVTTGFNDTNGDDIDIGVSGGDDDLFMSAGDLNTAATVAFDDLAIANAISTSERTVTWNYTTAASGDGTAGAAEIVLWYCVDNDG
jgi:hypothetical protein